ncbi:MAG: type II toxin-antitoxin system RelB/DinJ family antitoxin [Terriglobia bacterium]
MRACTDGAIPSTGRAAPEALQSDAVRILLVRVAAEKALPFEVKVPKGVVLPRRVAGTALQ